MTIMLPCQRIEVRAAKESNVPATRKATARFVPAQSLKGNTKMEVFMQPVLFAAAGYSLVYLLAGGGVFGAIAIFIIAKMLGK
jgi:hypothetical protein